MKRTQIIATWITMLALVAVPSLLGSADEGAQTWLRSYEGETYGAFYDIVQADESHVMVTGTTYHSQAATTLGDVLVAKLTMETSYGK